MKVLTPGHRYELANFDRKNEPGQTIQFIQKIPPIDTPYGSLETVTDGTTNEEVLRMLIDRLQSLYAKFPSDETSHAIRHCKDALYALQSRTYDRQQRGVEGQTSPMNLAICGDPSYVADVNRRFLIELGWSRKRRKKWLRRYGIPLHGHPDTDSTPDDTCWCGETNPYHAPLPTNCGGSGMIQCLCGGDLCVCHNHGEVECFGCADCEHADEVQDDDHYEPHPDYDESMF